MSIERQTQLEADMLAYGVDQYMESLEALREAGEATSRGAASRVMQVLVPDLVDSLDLYLEFALERQAGRVSQHRDPVVDILSELDSLDVVLVSLSNVLSLCLAEPRSRTKVIRTVGTCIDRLWRVAVQESALSDDKEEQARWKKQLGRSIMRLESSNKSREDKRASIAKTLRFYKGEFDIDIDDCLTLAQQMQVGNRLYELIIQTCNLEGLPVFKEFSQKAKTRSAHTRKMLNIGPEFASILQEADEDLSKLFPQTGPCVVEPLDWSTTKGGGFHTEDMQRSKGLFTGKARNRYKDLSYNDCPKVFDAVNALQKVSYRINWRVLEVMESAAQLPDFPALAPLEPSPKPGAPSWLSGKSGKDAREGATPEQEEQFQQFRRDLAAWNREEGSRISRRLQQMTLLSAANRYKGESDLYFVYCMDGRGRVYAQSQQINPQGSDMHKAVLLFREDCSLNSPESRKAFLMYGASLFGMDKASKDEKLKKACSSEFDDAMLTMASDPLSYTDWALQEEPWCALAWVFEYTRWQDQGESFRTSLPIPLDATCSGLQHLSALIRDREAGESVNLCASGPDQAPKDIYTDVLDALSDIMNQQASSEEARMWSGKLERSLVKRPTMTLVYAATMDSRKQYTRSYMSDLNAAAKRAQMPEPFPKDRLWPVATQMAHRITQALGAVVNRPMEVLAYFKEVAGLFAKEDKPMYWTTPDGFRVKHEELNRVQDLVNVKLLSGLRTNLFVTSQGKRIKGSAMKTSIAPSLIHSLDAAHLRMSVLQFDGKPVRVIHDCLAALPSQVGLLQDAVRRSWVDMYELDVLKSLKEDWESQLDRPEKLPKIPDYGDLDPREVFDSSYHFH